MNKAGFRYRLWPHIWRLDRWRGHLLISLVFLLLLTSLLVSLGRYWANTLQPRLYANAETQAQILAQSQATVLVKALEHRAPEELSKTLLQVVQEMLLATDPAINDRMVRGIALLIDYDMVPVEPGTLDFAEGDAPCNGCFTVSMPLLSQDGALLGAADFNISERYYTLISREMKSKLYTESSLALGLLIAVWLTMLAMFDWLHRAKIMIEASDRAKTRFMANVTHELRTPLNAILGYTQIYKADADLPQVYRQGIETIDRSAEHLLLLINDILDFSRTDQKGLQLHPSKIHLPTLLNTLVEIARISAKMKGVAFVFQFPEQLPSHVITDDKRLRQVLLNLLSNAIKFTQQGEVKFSVQILQQQANAFVFRFSVLDTGIGIAKEDLNKIFIPFHQLDNAITRAEGSGLGLTISHRIVRLMGSALRVKSVPGQGSEFWFDLTLPIAGQQEVLEPMASEKDTPLTLNLPPQEILLELLEHCRQHNVLAIRNLMKSLEGNTEYHEFLTEIQPYLRNYRYKQLVQLLETLNGSRQQ